MIVQRRVAASARGDIFAQDMDSVGQGKFALIQRFQQVKFHFVVLDIIVPVSLVGIGLGAPLELVVLETFEKIAKLALVELANQFGGHD